MTKQYYAVFGRKYLEKRMVTSCERLAEEYRQTPTADNAIKSNNAEDILIYLKKSG
jgi:hypothetical protein